MIRNLNGKILLPLQHSDLSPHEDGLNPSCINRHYIYRFILVPSFSTISHFGQADSPAVRTWIQSEVQCTCNQSMARKVLQVRRVILKTSTVLIAIHSL
ncbi:hypothetical protein ABKN59_007322 [Abortiporus biennis]